jgi:hypothetical protein
MAGTASVPSGLAPLAPFASPYRQPDPGGPHNPLRTAPLDWRRTMHGAVAMALGLVGAPAVIARLAREAHAVLPELFVGLAGVAGGALAALFVSVLWSEHVTQGSRSGTTPRLPRRS